MFTNEFEFDETVSTIMDDEGQYEDVHLIITDDNVFIRQYDEDMDKYEVIQMSPKMFEELLKALHKPEGMFYSGVIKKKE